MRRAVVRTAVRLDLDDAGDPPAGLVVTDQARAEQPTRDLRCRSREAPPVEGRQEAPPGNIERMLLGMNNPTSMKNAGMIVSRKIATIWD